MTVKESLFPTRRLTLVGRLQGLLAEAHGGLLRALDYRAATPEGLAIKRDVRDALRRTEFQGNMGLVGS